MTDDFFVNSAERYKQEILIKPEHFNKPNIKKGLRNADGSGVVAGITQICNVHGYVMDEGELSPVPGELHTAAIRLTILPKPALKTKLFALKKRRFSCFSVICRPGENLMNSIPLSAKCAPCLNISQRILY